MLSNFKKYSFIYTIHRKKMAKGSRELNQMMLAKRIHLRHRCPRADHHSPGGRAGSSESTILTPSRPWLQSQTGLVKSVPGQGQRTRGAFVLSSGPLRKSWVGLGPHISLISYFFWIPVQGPGAAAHERVGYHSLNCWSDRGCSQEIKCETGKV